MITPVPRQGRRQGAPWFASRPFLAAALPLVFACGGSPTGSDAPAQSGWGQPEVLAEEVVFDSLVTVSLAGNVTGNAIAVWAPSSLPNPPVLARGYSPGDGWRPVETADRGGDSSVNTPTARMNQRGDVMAFWNTSFGLMASRRAVGGAWDGPDLVVGASPYRGCSYSWGLDDAGNALVAWSAGSTISTSRFEPGLGWRNLGALPGGDSFDFLEVPALTVSGSGRALAAWPTTSEEIRATAFDPQLGWSASYRLSPEPSHVGVVGVSRSQATTFANATGDGIVAWVENDPSVVGSYVLHASLFDEATGFSAAKALGPTAATVIAASVGADGNTLVVYMTGLGLRRQRHLAGIGWQEPEPLDGVGGFEAVSLDGNGNGWALWNEQTPGSPVDTLLSRRLVDGRATGQVEQIAPPFAGLAWFCGMTMDAQGGLTAAWFQSIPGPDGAAERYSLVANHYRPAGSP